VELTGNANTLARKCRERHEVVRAFLLALGVSEATAIAASDGIEHHVSPETLRVMKQVLQTRCLPAVQ